MTESQKASDEQLAGVAGRLLLAVLAVVVAAAVLFAFAPGVLPDALTEWITRQVPVRRSTVRLVIIGVAVAGMVVVVTAGMVRRRRRRRDRLAAGKARDRRSRFAAGLASELPKGYDPVKDCRASRWRKGRPQRVWLRLPAGFADGSATAQQALTRVLAERMGTKVTADWSSGGTVVFRPVTTSPDELARERGRDRAAGLAGELFGGRCTVTVHQWGGPDGTFPEVFAVAYPITTKDDSAAFRRRTEAVLGDKLGGGLRLKSNWDRQRDRVRFEPCPPMPENVAHPGAQICHTTDRLFLPLGLTADNETAGWDAGKYPHALANGATGSGKTAAVRSFIDAALIKQWEVYCCDVKRVEFSGYRATSWGVKSIASKDEDMSDLLLRIKAVMDERYDLGEQRINRGENPRWDTFTPMLVVLDEFTELVLAFNDLHKAQKLKGTPEGVTATGRLARLARVCNIHLIVLTQRPDADSFPAGARENFTYRFSMNALSEQAAKMMWQNTEWGRYLPPVPGRALAGAVGAEPQEVQCFWTPDPAFPPAEDEKLRDELREAAQTAQAKVPASIQGQHYDLGPLRPSPEASRDDLVPNAGELDQAQLSDGRTVETARVLAETLTPGDRILHNRQAYQLRRVDEPDTDTDQVTIVIQPYQQGSGDQEPQTITCTLGDHLTRIDDDPAATAQDDPTYTDASPAATQDTTDSDTEHADTEAADTEDMPPANPDVEGGPDDPPAPPEWAWQYAADGPPLPGQEFPADDPGDIFRPPAAASAEAAQPVPPPARPPSQQQQSTPKRVAEQEDAVTADQSMAAMFRQAWESISGDPTSQRAARDSLIASAPDTPAMRAVIADLQTRQATIEHDYDFNEADNNADNKGVEDTGTAADGEAPGDTGELLSQHEKVDRSEIADGQSRAADLQPGDRVRMQNRKRQRVAYDVSRVEPRSDGRVEVTLKPARGRERVEVLTAAEPVELD